MNLDSKSPSGPIDKKWESHRFEMKLVNPANKRKYSVIVVGSGLAGGAAAATLGELGEAANIARIASTSASSCTAEAWSRVSGPVASPAWASNASRSP